MSATPSPPSPDQCQAAGPWPGERVTFRCVLDQQPGYLAPATALPRARRGARSRLIVNPRCCFSWTDGTPQAVAEVAAFLALDQHDSVVWVPAPTGWQPFWAGEVYRHLLADCRPGAPVPAPVPEPALMVLRRAGILVPQPEKDLAAQRWQTAAARSARAFRRNRYASIPGLIHGFHMDALRKFYRRLVRTGGMYLGDAQTSRRYADHNEPVSRFFHHQLTHAICEIAGEKVKPSYSYVVSYRGGAELEKHTDREQCEFSLSLLVDYPPERERESPWPLCIESGRRTVVLTQNVGDAILFCGRDLPHFRPRLPEGYTSTSMLLHYVREDFAGSLD